MTLFRGVEDRAARLPAGMLTAVLLAAAAVFVYIALRGTTKLKVLAAVDLLPF